MPTRPARITPLFARLQPTLALAARQLDEALPLRALSARAGMSPFHLQRIFAGLVGETPKQFVLRLRLSRAAALLVSSGDSVLDIALACGFQTHEGFTRAFSRRFGRSPRAYRARGLSAGGAAASHASVVERVAPCVGLFHMKADDPPVRTDMSYAIVRKVLEPQPVLVARRRIKRSDIAAAIGGAMPKIFEYAQRHGIALSGHPLTRYVDIGPGLLTLETGFRTAPRADGPSPDATAPNADGVFEDTWPGGPAATTIHAGTYETLSNGYAAIETWLESNGIQPAGTPWEDYITDPADFPDPKDWKTEICWPIRQH